MAYCSKCGNELEKENCVCNACESTTNYNNQNEKLLISGKGKESKTFILYLVISIIGLAILSYELFESISSINSTNTNIFTNYMFIISSLGSTALLILLVRTFFIPKSIINVYEDKVEGIDWNANKFILTYDQITNVTANKLNMIIKAGKVKHICFAKNPLEIQKIIFEMKNKK